MLIQQSSSPCLYKIFCFASYYKVRVIPSNSGCVLSSDLFLTCILCIFGAYSWIRRDPRCDGGQPAGMRSIWFRSTSDASDASGAKSSRDIWRLSFHQSHLSATRAVIEPGPESRKTRGTYYIALELEFFAL